MSISIPPDYPARIKSLRAKLGLTQQRLADLMGVSYASVNRWENEKSRPSALAWQRIVRAGRLGLDGLAGEQIGEPTVQEAQAPYGLTQVGPPHIDFSAAPQVVSVVAEGERLAHGYLFNPAFATETSLIEPLPHQRLAVYERMLSQARLRFLLADDAGAGKTIMTGLYVREMLARRLIRRVLIVPPAGLVGNWEREMRTLFSLPFVIASGSDARAGNPFVGEESSLLIVSVDTLAGARMFSRLQETDVEPYDLVVFDEAHKLSARREPDFTVRKTQRYRLAEALAGTPNGSARWHLDWHTHHVLLLTATPHMGKEFPYYCLWRLLEPEVLSTMAAFTACPADVRQRHFIRRTKEEMVRYDGTCIYPQRVSDTLSYELSQGEVSEQKLYDKTTGYIQTYYNRARILNRSAARFAMGVFQRRLASSTYALMRSFERRIAKLDALIDDIEAGRLTPEQMVALQQRLTVHDTFDEMTADEEDTEDGREQNEVEEERALGSVVAVSLADLQGERRQVEELLDLAKRVHEAGHETKFAKLCEVVRDPRFKDEKLIVFTEHRDTLTFLVRRLEGLGFGGKVAQIHGGMDYRAREEQMEFFRRPAGQGGATYLVATDAAGEGINLQFCWLMVNYDIPWNPGRLEQRMGRIHRYGQKHDPVVIINLVAGSTREGRVLKTLLTKLELIRKELGSDKVFDVIGRLFEGVSLRQYMEQAVSEQATADVEQKLEGTLTKEQVLAIQAREQRLYGDGGDVQRELPRLKASVEKEVYSRLLPGYVRQFIQRATPLVGAAVDGDLDGMFGLRPITPGALDPLLPMLEVYPAQQRRHLTVYRPEDPHEAIWLHPGEPCFDGLRSYVCSRFQRDALKGAVFVDPTASGSCMFHLALVTTRRKADANYRTLAHGEVLDCRLVGLRQREGGQVEPCPVEHLLLLKGSEGIPASAMRFAASAQEAADLATAFAVESIARGLAEERRAAMVEALPEREDFVRKGYDYQDAELAAARARLTDKARTGDARAKGELTRVKERQRRLYSRREEALAVLRREPELVAPGEVTFLAHALIVPSSDPEDRKRHDAAVEAVAVRLSRAYEESKGAEVRDVSTPPLARAAGLVEHPGFDLLSLRPDGDELAIEVKGRAGIGDIELTENEWAKACNLRERYWLYVVFGCTSPQPRLLRVRDPFDKLIVRAKGGVVIEESEILEAATTD